MSCPETTSRSSYVAGDRGWRWPETPSISRIHLWQVTEDHIRAGLVRFPIAGREKRRLARQFINSCWYRLIRHPTKPKFFGLAVAMWRCDYERVNGYDENFVGWGARTTISEFVCGGQG